MTQVSHQTWGEVANVGIVDLWVLQSCNVQVEVLTLGAIIRAVCCRGNNGQMEDVVLGYDDLEGYVSDKRYMGAVVGRVANRIAGGRFVVEEKEYQLEINNGPNALHGGLKGFNKDHSYALPTCHGALKARLSKAMAKVESMEREKRNAKDREQRAKSAVCGLLEEVRAKNLINEELKEKLDLYSDLPVHLLSKQGHKYTKDQREFALTLHLHGPKAYAYLRESLHLNLLHQHTLQRWMSSVDAKPGLNKMMLDMLRKKQEEDPTKYGHMCLMLDSMSIR